MRHTRDKRGYETTFVMHGYRPAQGPQRTRVLYMFRSPSYVRMGRRALDEEAREALEHTHPDLTFDWSVLGRDVETIRVDDRDRDRDREGGRGRRGPGPQGRPKPAAPMPVTVDDQSLLGRTIGGETAARFRARYTDLLQRIVRRSRTPEERDRLTEQAQRLNPDDWPDAEAVRAHATTIEAEWDALTVQLPGRRRGRRGGRREDRQPGQPEAVTDAPEETTGAEDEADEPLPSGIMTSHGERDASQGRVDTTGPADAGGDRADASGIGTDTVRGTTGNGLPGDDELR